MPKENFPQIWDEDGKSVGREALRRGCLVKITLDTCDPITSVIGIFKGIEGCEGDHLVIVEVPIEIHAATAGRMCITETREWDLRFVRLIEILAVKHHAAFEMFHAYGVMKVRHDNHKSKIKSAVETLGGKYLF